jgi:hypothetical protein
MPYIFIDKTVYYNNKRLIDNFIDQQLETKIVFQVEDSIAVGCVEIYVGNLSSFDSFVEYVFRNLGKDIIACVGFDCPNFEKLKEMNVIIPEIYERMWTEKLRLAYNSAVLADAKDYMLIELLDRYEIYYIYGHNDNNVFDQIYYKTIEDRISEYRRINNEEPYHTEEPFFRY